MSRAEAPALIPRFKRPSQAVVFLALERLCADGAGACEISLRELARHCGLSVNTTHRAVRDFVGLGLATYRPGRNQTRRSLIALSTAGRAKLSRPAHAVARVGVAHPSDSDPDLCRDIYLDDGDGGRVHSKRCDGDPDAQDRLAERIASGLDDTKNLALYRSYCRRYPMAVVLKAYIRASEAPKEKIRKSRGALFNFLVTLYAKRRNN